MFLLILFLYFLFFMCSIFCVFCFLLFYILFLPFYIAVSVLFVFTSLPTTPTGWEPNCSKYHIIKNQCIRGKTGAQNIVKEIKQYQKKWLQHVQRMDTNRIPKQALQCRPKGRRNIGRPKKRWRDQLHFED